MLFEGTESFLYLLKLFPHRLAKSYWKALYNLAPAGFINFLHNILSRTVDTAQMQIVLEKSILHPKINNSKFQNYEMSFQIPDIILN